MNGQPELNNSNLSAGLKSPLSNVSVHETCKMGHAGCGFLLRESVCTRNQLGEGLCLKVYLGDVILTVLFE